MISAGSPPCSSGRWSRPATRRTSTGSGQRSQTDTASSRTTVARLGVHEGAAAERQHQRIAGQQAADHPALAVAERRLAVAGEQFGDGAAGGQLDLGVGVAERQAEPRGQPPADRGLAGAHQPDQTMLRPASASGSGMRVASGAVLRVMARER